MHSRKSCRAAVRARSCRLGHRVSSGGSPPRPDRNVESWWSSSSSTTWSGCGRGGGGEVGGQEHPPGHRRTLRRAQAGQPVCQQGTKTVAEEHVRLVKGGSQLI